MARTRKELLAEILNCEASAEAVKGKWSEPGAANYRIYVHMKARADAIRWTLEPKRSIVQRIADSLHTASYWIAAKVSNTKDDLRYIEWSFLDFIPPSNLLLHAFIPARRTKWVIMWAINILAAAIVFSVLF